MGYSPSKILCFSSIGGLMGLPFQGLYSASKFAIEGYCEALRLETKAFGIQVVVIEPGDFATAFTAQRKSVADPAAYEVYQTYAKSLASIEHDETTGLKPPVGDAQEAPAAELVREDPRLVLQAVTIPATSGSRPRGRGKPWARRAARAAVPASGGR